MDDQLMDGGMMGGMMMGGMGAWMVLWGLVGLAILALAVVGIIWLVQKSAPSAAPASWQRESADDILRRRYASGEIDEEQFHQRMSTLSA